MTHLKTPLPTQGFQSFASALMRQLRLQPSLNFSCPRCDTTSVEELALACRPVEEPVVASPPSNAGGQNDTQHLDVAVLENDSPNHLEVANMKKSRVSGVQENDETLLLASVRSTMTPSSCDVVGGENSHSRAIEPVLTVKRKSKKGEALELKMSNISPLFGLRLPNAAKKLGISTSSLKKACRYVGLHRWPGRKVRGLESTIEGLERAIVGQGGNSNNLKVASMRSEIPKLQQELNELCHGTPAQITEKMHSPAVITTNVYKRLYYMHGRRSEHHNPGGHDINTGNQPNLTSRLAPPPARKNSTGTNRVVKAKKQPERKQQLAPCTGGEPPKKQKTPNADKESARPSPRKYIRPSPRRKMRLSTRLSSRDTEMKASDIEGLLPDHDFINVAVHEVPESVVQAQNGNNMTLREFLLKRKLEGKATGTCEGSMAVTKNGNNMNSNAETGGEGTGDGKVAVEEGATVAEPSAKRPKTE